MVYNSTFAHFLKPLTGGPGLVRNGGPVEIVEYLTSV